MHCRGRYGQSQALKSLIDKRLLASSHHIGHITWFFENGTGGNVFISPDLPLFQSDLTKLEIDLGCRHL